MGTIERQCSVVVCKNRRVTAGSATFTTNTKRFAEGIVRQQSERSGLPIPCDLQAAVIRIHLVVDDLQRAITKRTRGKHLAAVISSVCTLRGAGTPIGGGSGVAARIAVGQPSVK